MPRPKKKTPLDTPPPLPVEALESPDSASLQQTPLPPAETTDSSRSRTPFLTLEEKRKWLARILRDTSGQHQGFELSLSDKFKALIEDNKLAGHPDASDEAPQDKPQTVSQNLPELLRALLGTVPPPQEQHFRRQS